MTLQTLINRAFIFLFSIILIPSAYCQNTGQISGYVRSVQNQAPLPNATVRIIGPDFSKNVVTDNQGFFRLSQLSTTTYTAEATCVGYKTQRKYDLSVTSGNAIEINFELENEIALLGGVKIKSTFTKPAGTVNSFQSLGLNEVSKYPGANFDIAKVVQSLPGVSGSVGFRNDIIIRGGAPNENVYYLDGIEVPSINHFATQGAAGGPVGMLNVSFIENVNLHTSSFPARYDNPLSGVLQFKQRSGNPDKVQGNFRLSASEAALTMEGPLGEKNGNTTFIASVRRSYLQFLFQLIELPFLPDYWDYQYKITHRPDAKNEINIIGIGAIDNFTIKAPENPTLEQQSILDQIPTNGQRTNTLGISWRHTLKNGFTLLSVSNSYLDNFADKFENNEGGNESKRILKYASIENETRARYEINTTLRNWVLNTGLVANYAAYRNTTFQRRPGLTVNYKTNIDFFRYGAFFQASRRFLKNNLLLAIGIRSDGNTFTDKGNDISQTLSPRLSLSYTLTPGLNANMSVGRYYKLPPYTTLGFTQNNQFINKDALYIRSDHITAGLEWSLPEVSTRITAEAFYKKYGNYPISYEDAISLANLGGDFAVLGNERVISKGGGKTYGIELMYQKRLSKHFYGIFTYTYYRSLFNGLNPDKSVSNNYLPSAWDYRHLVSFTGGYKFGKNWEVGFRFRYQGKAPYTPYDIDKSLQYYPFTNQPVTDYSRINSERLRAFNAADLRVDKKWNFKKWTLDLFMDVQNAYNSKNPTRPDLTLKRNPDNTIATTTGEPYNPGSFFDLNAPNNRNLAIPVEIPNNSGALLPSIGFIVEF